MLFDLMTLSVCLKANNIHINQLSDKITKGDNTCTSMDKLSLSLFLYFNNFRCIIWWENTLSCKIEIEIE